MASAPAATPSAPAAGTSGEADGSFECNICLDTAKDAVVSLCGHLFWYVLHCLCGRGLRPLSSLHPSLSLSPSSLPSR